MDAADHAKAYQDAHIAAALAAQHDRWLRQQQAARQRAFARAMARDCADCGDSIPALRLIAVPLATRCTACQAIAERPHVV